MITRQYAPDDQRAVIALWERCGLLQPWNDPAADLDRAHRRDPDLLLVHEHGGAIIASVVAGFDGHRGWIYYLAVDASHRHRGVARDLLQQAERRLAALGCPRVNLMTGFDGPSLSEFYHRLGYAPIDVQVFGRQTAVSATG